MKTRAIAITLTMGLLVWACAGCGNQPYPKERLGECISELCLAEYGIKDVSVKIVGKTLGVQLFVDKLFDGLSKFDEAAREKMEDVLLVLRRVCLSTDAKLDFFTLVVSDRTTNLQVSRSGYITDIKKAMFGAISVIDYGHRVKIAAVPDLFLLGRARVEAMFEHLRSKKISMAFLAANTDLANKENPLLAKYLVSLLQTSKDETRGNEILELRSRVTGPETIVFYVRAQEDFVPADTAEPETEEDAKAKEKQAAEKPAAKTPETRQFEFLFWVKIANYKSTVDRIHPLVGPNGEREALPDSISGLKDYKSWPETDFYTSDLELDEFLADQMAQRIQRAFAEMEDNKMVQKLFNVEGSYDNGFVLTFKSKTKETISQMMIDLALSKAKEVCQSYDVKIPSAAIRIMDKENQLVHEFKPAIKVS